MCCVVVDGEEEEDGKRVEGDGTEAARALSIHERKTGGEEGDKEGPVADEEDVDVKDG